MGRSPASWSALEAAAPAIAAPGERRLREAGVALLGTIRADGSPRISPVEPYLVAGELLFGSLAWSAKTRDLTRDARCVLHSAVTGPDAGEEELKLYGRAVKVDDEDVWRGQAVWWASFPREAARVFALAIERAALVAWDAAAGVMTLRTWSPALGARERTRPYP